MPLFLSLVARSRAFTQRRPALHSARKKRVAKKDRRRRRRPISNEWPARALKVSLARASSPFSLSRPLL